MTSYCPKCGVDILRTTSRFCDHCGVDLTNEVVHEGESLSFSVSDSEKDVTMILPTRSKGGAHPLPGSPAPTEPSTKTIPEIEDDRRRESRLQRTSARNNHSKTVLTSSQVKITRPGPLDMSGDRLIHQRYRVVETLGQGGFGSVYLAVDIKLERLCVVKQMLSKKSTPQKLEIHRANFEREAKLLVRLNHPGHPNIPEIYDYFFEDEGNYLVMKYIEGRSLHQILKKSDTLLPAQDVIRYAVDLCSALDYMHTYFDEPVMHRDIKPANILLGNDGRIWLVDFGLAKAQQVASDEAAMSQASGTAGYTPLEQWLGELVPASDIYALGATLHYLLTGLNPADVFGNEFNIVKMQQMHGQFIPLRKIDKNLPAVLEGVVMGATGADPEQRPTALQMKHQLSAFVSGSKNAPLFTFKNGRSVQNEQELADLCDSYKREAQGYLYRGDFERWFRLINRNDLAEAAEQAVSRGKNQHDGLEKFLRMVLPNLFLRRLGRASLQFARGALQFIVSAVVALVILAILGSFMARLMLWQAIGNYDWDFTGFEAGRNTYSEAYLDETAAENLDFIFNKVLIDTRDPNQVDISLNWGGILIIKIPLRVELIDDYPQIDLAGINDIPLFLITDNIARGVNAGIALALSEAPITITNLEVRDSALLIDIEKEIHPSDLPSPEPLPTPSGPGGTDFASTRTTTLIVFNELGREIILEIDGQSWPIGANEAELIQVEPGAHSYAIKYAEDEPPVSEGRKEWRLDRYELHIGLNID